MQSVIIASRCTRLQLASHNWTSTISAIDSSVRIHTQLPNWPLPTTRTVLPGCLRDSPHCSGPIFWVQGFLGRCVVFNKRIINVRVCVAVRRCASLCVAVRRCACECVYHRPIIDVRRPDIPIVVCIAFQRRVICRKCCNRRKWTYWRCRSVSSSGDWIYQDSIYVLWTWWRCLREPAVLVLT